MEHSNSKKLWRVYGLMLALLLGILWMGGPREAQAADRGRILANSRIRAINTTGTIRPGAMWSGYCRAIIVRSFTEA